MENYDSIVILTGAGISAESGIETFRDKDGLWAKIDFAEVATPEGFAADPAKVHKFYNMRRARLASVEPNAAHRALAELEREFNGDVLLVTQNIDSLHEKAGSRNVVHMHGEMSKALCTHCGQRHEWLDELSVDTACPSCTTIGFMRPDVVWFGEIPYHLDRIYRALGNCDLFLSIGTSGNVYPAAQFVEEASMAGARTVELNLERSDGAHLFDEALQGPATSLVSSYVDLLLKR